MILIFRGNTMVPLLLLLLMPDALADNVCLNISDGNIDIIIPNNLTNITTLNIVDKPSGNLDCTADGFDCDLLCTSDIVNKTVWELDNRSLECSPAKTDVKTQRLVIDIGYYYKCLLILCKNEDIMPLITSLKTSYDLRMMKHLLYLRARCPDLFSTDQEVKAAFIRAERQIIHNIMEITKFDTGGSKNYNLTSLSLHMVNFSEADLASADLRIRMEAPQLLPENEPFIPKVWLPVEALHSIPQERRVVCLVSYRNYSQFQDEITSMVLRIELLEEQSFHYLKTPIKMTFQVVPPTYMDNDSLLQCHYFDENDLSWKTGGCETSVNQTEITCNCNHATPFAVLLVRGPISKVHWEILSIISYIGCGLSAFFTALSLVIFVFSRNHRMDISISIHVSLSGALFLLNTTFLLSEWGATVKPDWVCVFIAAAMHYSLLCCFTWMAIEALHLYLLLIKVFNTYFKHYLVKLCLAGWGIPGIIVAVSLGVKDFKQFYGITHMSVADTNQTNAICWITDDSFFYSMNLVYFTLIFIFNTGILIAVASNICKMKHVSRSSSKAGAGAEGDAMRFGETCKSSLTVVGLTCLMGTTWGLAFLGSGYVNYTILYLFCILNSTQGFFIFLWICLSAKKQRKRDMEERLTSTPVKTSAVKYD